MNTAPIGIFDSGLGGLTVAHEMRRMLPNESLIYLGDTARCPYGPRDPREVRRFVLEIGSYLVDQGIKMLVVACNTGTAAGLAAAQRAFDIPVIGVVEPGARAAVRATHTRRVGVIGTVGTVNSGAYSDAVRAIDAGVTVFSTATPLFVDIVERGLMFDPSPVANEGNGFHDVYLDPKFYEVARDYLTPLKQSDIDTLVLGCTHYPLLKTAIAQVMGGEVELVSSASETAEEVKATLERSGDIAGADRKPEYRFITTGDPAAFDRLGSRIFGAPLGVVSHLELAELSASLSPSASAHL